MITYVVLVIVLIVFLVSFLHLKKLEALAKKTPVPMPTPGIDSKVRVASMFSAGSHNNFNPKIVLSTDGFSSGAVLKNMNLYGAITEVSLNTFPLVLVGSKYWMHVGFGNYLSRISIRFMSDSNLRGVLNIFKAKGVPLSPSVEEFLAGHP